MTIRDFEQYTPDIDDTAFVDEAAVVTGNVVIGAESSVWPMCSVRGDIHSIRIGARTNIQDGSILHVSHDSKFAPGGFPLAIGDDVTVGHNAVVHACTVGNRVLVGMGAVLLDGAVIEDDVMIGAGALVPPKKVLESGYLYIGSPAKQARELTEKEREFLLYSAEHYVELGQRHKKV